MKMSKIEELIQKLDICDKNKEVVKDILREMGADIPEIDQQLQCGQLWYKPNANEYYVVTEKDGIVGLQYLCELGLGDPACFYTQKKLLENGSSKLQKIVDNWLIAFETLNIKG